LAVECPDIEVTLLDRSTSRVAFLRWAVGALGLDDRVYAVEADAAELAHHPEHRGAYDGLVSRSFGPAPAVAEISAGLLRAGGRVVVSEPPAASGVDDGRWPEVPLATVGLELIDVVTGPPRFARLRRLPNVASDAPRPWKQVRKRPIY
jgi:16S rRNA (guanine527-N7)-methyltransferase